MQAQKTLWGLLVSDARATLAMYEGLVDVLDGQLARGEELLSQPLKEVPADARHAMRMLAQVVRGERDRRGLVLGERATTFRLHGGERVDLSRRASLHRILSALAMAHGQGPLPRSEVFAAGWPGESIHPDSQGNRVRVAIATLRKLGLTDVLNRTEEGYSLDPSLGIRWEG